MCFTSLQFPMSTTCKLKTFYEKEALISFKFTNKDTTIRKTS